MSPCERKALANRAVGQVMVEIAVADPTMPVAYVARQIAREVALQLRAVCGSRKAAEALYALADEMVGAK